MKKLKNYTSLILIILNFLKPHAAMANNFVDRMEVKNFIEYMHKQHNFDSNKLVELFKKYNSSEEVLTKISNPSEKLSWGKYKKLLLSQERIAKGKEFLKNHHNTLIKAENHYGVPKEIIVAILGIESFYGARTGNIPVIEALLTLSFDYPIRSKFFIQELEHFLLLTEEAKLDPIALKGSYAGAMSPAQFIPSSYRNFAVDFAGTGTKDLNIIENSIGSIANYLARSGWNKDAPVAKLIKTKPNRSIIIKYLETNTNSPKPKYSLQQFKALGINDKSNIALTTKASLLEFDAETATAPKEYWLGFHNFYVITRYNHSANYAMAVYQLGTALGLNANLSRKFNPKS